MRENAKQFAIEQHAGQLYDGKPYALAHCARVVKVLIEFGYDTDEWIAAGWTHDVVEDCMKELTPEQRIQVIRNRYNNEVAELVWSVTGIGETRKIRNADIYRKLTLFPKGCILKVADRIVNVEHSKADSAGDNYRAMYKKEMTDFASVIKEHVPEKMWDRLEKLFEDKR